MTWITARLKKHRFLSMSPMHDKFYTLQGPAEQGGHMTCSAGSSLVKLRSQIAGVLHLPRTFCFFEPFCFLAGLGLSSPSGVMGPLLSSSGRFLLFFAEPSTA